MRSSECGVRNAECPGSRSQCASANSQVEATHEPPLWVAADVRRLTLSQPVLPGKRSEPRDLGCYLRSGWVHGPNVRACITLPSAGQSRELLWRALRSIARRLEAQSEHGPTAAGGGNPGIAS